MAVNIFDLRVKEDSTPYLKKVGSTKLAEGVLNSPKLISELFCKVFGADKCLEEHVWEICLDVKMNPVALFEISHGTINASAVSPANIYRRALLSSAARVVIAHNHPSGDPFPSGADEELTKKIASAGEILEIPLSDHLIIGKKGAYYSFMERGQL